MIEKPVKDIWFATYLERQNKRVVDYVQIEGQRKKYNYIFQFESEEEYKTLRLDFKSSEENEIKQKQAELLDLIH